jgi:hypothetical protein
MSLAISGGLELHLWGDVWILATTEEIELEHAILVWSVFWSDDENLHHI